MALVRAGSASHTDVEKKAKRPITAKTIFHPPEDGFLPVFGELPVIIRWLPFSREREAKIILMLRGSRVTIGSLPEFYGWLHPILWRRGIVNL
jgi:hypothetical protein